MSELWEKKLAALHRTAIYFTFFTHKRARSAYKINGPGGSEAGLRKEGGWDEIMGIGDRRERKRERGESQSVSQSNSSKIPKRSTRTWWMYVGREGEREGGRVDWRSIKILLA